MKKMFAGQSGESQMRLRRNQGKFVMGASAIVGSVVIFIFSIMSLVEIYKFEYVPANEVAVVRVPKEGKIVVVVDQKIRCERDLEHFDFLDRDYPCILKKVPYNLYGHCVSWIHGITVVIFSPEDCREFMLEKRCKDGCGALEQSDEPAEND
jgi:hypothetical protein